SELTGCPSWVTPLSGAALNRTTCPLRMKVPQCSASAGLSRTSVLPAARPKLLSPSLSQKSPASVNQPSSLVSAATRCARHSSMAARSACASTLADAATAPPPARSASASNSAKSAYGARAGGMRRPIMPPAPAREYLLAHIVDLACTRGARALAALGARTAVAARTDDARRGCERIADPGDVEDVGDCPERLAGHLGYARLATPVQAFA